MKQEIVLVTGAGGAVGRHAARHFAASGAYVVGIGHGSWSEAEWRSWGLAKWHVADVDENSLRLYGDHPDVVIHCAGSGAVGFSVEHPFQDFQRTAVTTAAVLEFARTSAPGAAIVLPSSAGVYGAAAHLPTPEDEPLHPVSPYGVHKKIAEDLCLGYARQYGLKVAVVRLFSIYGEGFRKQLLWDACHRLWRGETGFSGTGAETRDWLHVEDAAALLGVAADHAGAACPVVNGGAGEAVSLDDFLGHLFVCWGRDDAPRFTGSGRPGDPQHYQADSRAARAWGWAPAVAWRDGVARYVDWFKREMAGTR